MHHDGIGKNRILGMKHLSCGFAGVMSKPRVPEVQVSMVQPCNRRTAQVVQRICGTMASALVQ